MDAAPPPPGLTHDRRAAWRIALTVLGVFLIALWPPALWRWQGVSAAVLLTLSIPARLPPGRVLRRAAVLWLFAGVMAIGLAGRSDWPVRAGNLLLKSTLSLWAVSLLVHSTPLAELVSGLRWLRLPRVWTETLAFWGRYYSVLAEEWRRLELARRARTFEPNQRRAFTRLANALGLLFIRAYERAEQVHRAMLARGYRERS
jgi:cobalt/nickel transport system permease protein